jgi:hypothetical protein
MPPGMDAPGPIDPETLRRRLEVIIGAIHTRRYSLAEAAAEARGLGRGLQPPLPASVTAGAVADILKSLGAYQPRPEVVELDGQTLRPVSPEDVADALAYAMRFNDQGKARRTGWEYAAQMAADHLVRQLQASGIIFMRRPTPPRHTAGG